MCDLGTGLLMLPFGSARSVNMIGYAALNIIESLVIIFEYYELEK